MISSLSLYILGVILEWFIVFGLAFSYVLANFNIF